MLRHYSLLWYILWRFRFQHSPGYYHTRISQYNYFPRQLDPRKWIERWIVSAGATCHVCACVRQASQLRPCSIGRRKRSYVISVIVSGTSVSGATNAAIRSALTQQCLHWRRSSRFDAGVDATEDWRAPSGSLNPNLTATGDSYAVRIDPAIPTGT